MKRIILLFLIFSLLPLAKAGAISEQLTVDMHYIVVNPTADGMVEVKHMVNYTNISEDEFKGEEGADGILEIPLPAGAANFQVQDDTLTVKASENGFITEKPIAPKDTQVIPYSYTMPAGIPLTMKLDYSIQVMQVLIPEGVGSLIIEGAKNSNAGLMQFEEKNFWLYNVEGIEENKEIKIILDKNTQPAPPETAQAGTDSAAESSTEQQSTGDVTRKSPDFHNPGHLRLWNQSPLKAFDPHILLIVLGSILAAGIGYYSYFKWKNRLQEQRIGADKEEQLFKQLLARQTAIMDKILELEDMYGQGHVKEEDYLAKLSAYKQHLVKVKLNLRHFIE